MDQDKQDQIRKGLLELAVLQVISARKVYVAELLTTLMATEFKTQEGTLYPLLSRLRREELLQYEWVESESGPPRKYYSLTAKGEKVRRELLTYIKTITSVVTKLGKIYE